MRLNELHSCAGSRRHPKRRGRGIGSGLGKTSGRGYKGQGARSGTSMNGFEGGQMPLHRRLPKRGFTNASFRKDYAVLTMAQLKIILDKGKIAASLEVITEKDLQLAKVVKKKRDGVQLIGNEPMTRAIKIETVAASKGARKALEMGGGCWIQSAQKSMKGNQKS